MSGAPVWRGRGRRGIKWFVLAGILVAGAGVFVVKARKGGSATDNKVLTAVVRRGNLEVTVLETGRIEPRAQAQVKSRVGGQVTEVTVQEGQKVTVGQALLRLEPTDYQREVARHVAEVEQARLMAEYTKLQLKRSKKARASAIAPQTELDQARHEAAAAQAKLDMGKVALATARDRLRYTAVTAPIEGTVIQRNINPGEAVVPGVTSTFEGKPLLVIADLTTLLVKVDLNQIDVARLRTGQKAEITVDALPGKKYTAQITKVAPAAVTGTHGQGAADVFPVEAQLDTNQDLSEIRPGMTADVRIVVATHQNALLLPIEAVITTGEKSHVLVLEADQEMMLRRLERRVQLGARNDRDVEIKGGLDEGDKVVINPPPPKEAKFQ